jgi:hypothetical protein
MGNYTAKKYKGTHKVVAFTMSLDDDKNAVGTARVQFEDGNGIKYVRNLPALLNWPIGQASSTNPDDYEVREVHGRLFAIEKPEVIESATFP